MNLSPGSLRMSAEYLRLIAKPEEDLETLAPHMLEDRPEVLEMIAQELCALAKEREKPVRWYHSFTLGTFNR